MTRPSAAHKLLSPLSYALLRLHRFDADLQPVSGRLGEARERARRRAQKNLEINCADCVIRHNHRPACECAHINYWLRLVSLRQL